VSSYPKAVDSDRVGEYPALAKSGAGYFYDDVLEYRVWCHPERGAPDEFEGEDYYYAFETYEEAMAFSEATQGSETPLVLIRQFEWINEPVTGTYIHEKGERIAEWQVQWLAGGKRGHDSIPAFLEAKNNP
jgi:hypothetical protein